MAAILQVKIRPGQGNVLPLKSVWAEFGGKNTSNPFFGLRVENDWSELNR